MEATVVTEQHASPPARIRSAIEQGQQETAKRLLLAYARDFGSRTAQDEALVLASRLATAGREQELHGKDTSAERSTIIAGMLVLTRRIEDEERKQDGEGPPQPPPPASEAASKRRLASPLLAGSEDNDPRSSRAPLTQLECDLRDFKLRAHRSRDVDASVAFECVGLGKRYSKGSVGFELSGVTLSLRVGEILGLVGENGSGKTTLLRLAAGELRHTEGTLRYPRLSDRRDVLDWQAVRRRISYVPQSPIPWYGRLRTNLQLVAAKHGKLGRDNGMEVDFWIHRLGLQAYSNARWDEISGGYKMRFELARAMLCQPLLLILDEPLAPLDIIAQRIFLQDLKDLAESRRAPLAMLVSSQHLYEIELTAKQLLFLRAGRVAFIGAPNAFDSKESGNLYEVACSMSRPELIGHLLSLGECRVEEFGRRFLIRTGIDAHRLLICLTQHTQVDYFHDLTHSTRRLFEEARAHD